MYLYVARHGETDWNAQQRLCGRTELPLNATGILQAEQLGKTLLAQNAKIERLIASPMIRTQQTAQIVARILDVTVETDERLIEQNYGVFEGGDIHEPAFQENRRQFAVRYPGGESMMQVANRVYAFLEELKTQGATSGVLLVSHGGTCRVLNTYFEDVTNDAFANWRMQNAQCLRYTL